MTATNVEAVSAQLTEELGASVRALGAILGMDILEQGEERVAARAPLLAAGLCSDDDRLAAQTAADVMDVLWPACLPEQAEQPEWWRTPVGRMAARSLGRDDTDAVTYSVAASILGVTKGTVSQLSHRGTLDRHPDGGLTRASILARIGRHGRD